MVNVNVNGQLSYLLNSTCGSLTAAALIFAVNHCVEIALSQDY